MAESHPLFGKLVYKCEKYTPRRAVYQANGGMSGILTFFFVAVPFISFIVAVVIGASFFGMQVKPVNFREIAPLFAAVYFFILLLSPFAFRKNFKYAEELKIALYERGIEVRFPGYTLEKPLHEISDVYFGTKSRLVNSALKAGSFIKPSQTDMAKKTFDNRLTIEITNDPGVALMNIYSYVQRESLNIFLNKLSEARNP